MQFENVINIAILLVEANITSKSNIMINIAIAMVEVSASVKCNQYVCDTNG